MLRYVKVVIYRPCNRFPILTLSWFLLQQAIVCWSQRHGQSSSSSSRPDSQVVSPTLAEQTWYQRLRLRHGRPGPDPRDHDNQRFGRIWALSISAQPRFRSRHRQTSQEERPQIQERQERPKTVQEKPKKEEQKEPVQARPHRRDRSSSWEQRRWSGDSSRCRCRKQPRRSGRCQACRRDHHTHGEKMWVQLKQTSQSLEHETDAYRFMEIKTVMIQAPVSEVQVYGTNRQHAWADSVHDWHLARASCMNWNGNSSAC